MSNTNAEPTLLDAIDRQVNLVRRLQHRLNDCLVNESDQDTSSISQAILYAAQALDVLMQLKEPR